MTQITLTVAHDLPKTQASLNQLQQKLGDLTPVLDTIGQQLEDSTVDRFATKIAPDGVSWANLMPSTIVQKGNHNILVESGDLASSITHHANKSSVTVGTPERYGVYHQFGTADMPARPFLGISSNDEQTIYTLINDYLDKL